MFAGIGIGIGFGFGFGTCPAPRHLTPTAVPAGRLHLSGGPGRGVSGLPRTFSTRYRPALYYQLAFRTPGISPFSAISRKQIRHMPNFRM
jgi:hypothetical protein